MIIVLMSEVGTIMVGITYNDDHMIVVINLYNSLKEWKCFLEKHLFSKQAMCCQVGGASIY